MRTRFGSPGFKAAVWTGFLACCFLGALLLLRAMPFWGFDGAAGFQDTRQYDWLLRLRGNQVAELLAAREELRGDDLSFSGRRELEVQAEDLAGRLERSVTNFRYLVLDDGGKRVLSNGPDGEELPSPVAYADFRLGEHALLNETWTGGYGFYWGGAASGPGPETSVDGEGETPPVYTLACSVLPLEELLESGVEDEFSRYAGWFTGGMEGRCSRAAAGCALLCAALAFLGLALGSAGRRSGAEGFVLTWQEKLPFDVYLLLMGAAVLCAAVAGAELARLLFALHIWDRETEGWLSAATAGGAACWTLAALGCALCLRTLAARRRARALARTTLLARAVQWAMEALRSFPFLWRVIAAFLAYFLASAALFSEARYNGWAGAVWWLLHIAVLLLLCWWAMGFRRLRKGGQAVAAGNLSYRIDTHRMPHDLRCLAEDLNNLSKGMAAAVDEQMKSERFKAELITNVSHDLKTPLTSIINYVDLLKTTRQEDPKAREYIKVLDRKSLRLKKLTEDLVEASKASTGVLSVSREKIGMAQLMDQALGEWREKLEDRKLALVTSLPEGETWVYADGRHLWRVLDNLLSNCSKYAMEGTRVYLDLTRGRGQVSFSVKNISREPLNVPPERLMERFVRGEESRTTEGSGLGLSIARSLTELQGGAFELAVDGDLFKATVTLPQAN